MPRNGSGVYSADWVNAAPNTTIESAKQNAMIADFVADANAARPITAGGTAGTTAVEGIDNLSTKATNIASAATTDIGAATGRFVHITGTTTITALGTKTAGVEREVVFDAALTLTHNATSLILPGGANITTAAGDTAIFVSEGSGNWKCLHYMRAVAPYSAGTFTPVVEGSTASGSGTYSTQTGQYVRIGNAVMFTYFVVYTGHTGTGNMLLAGLPFTAGSIPAAISVWVSNLTFSGQVIGFAENAASRVLLYRASDGNSSVQVAMDAAATVLVSGVYFV